MFRPLILSIGVDDKLHERDFPEACLGEARTLKEAALLMQENEPAVVVFGPEVKPSEIKDLLQNLGRDVAIRSAHIVLYRETPPGAFQDLVDDDAIFYLAHASIGPVQLRSTVMAALRLYVQQRDKVPTPSALTTEINNRLANLCLRTTQKGDLAALALALSEELAILVQATQARCLFYDPATDTLSVGTAEEGGGDLISPAAGLVGYVARTGERVRVEMATKDPRYDPHADNPGGATQTHLIAIALRGNGGTTLGVFTATRASHLAPFSVEDESRIEQLAGRAAPLMDILLSNLSTGQTDSYGHRNSPYRKEALDYDNCPASEGRLLGGIPLWLSWSHLLVLIFLGIGVAYVLFAKVHQAVTGPAIVRVTEKITVTALNSGVVSNLLVAPGSQVTEGELLATLQSSPGDSLLTRLREEVRAPVDGVVSDIHIRVGQVVESGEQVMSLAGEGSTSEVLALLPGSSAPEIHAGMPLILRLDGYPQSREDLTILDVTPDVFGPSDAARYVGKEIAQTLSLSGPILMVRSRLSRDTFASADERFRYHDGMIARAEVRIRKEPLITALMPGIKQLYDDPRIGLDRIQRAQEADR
jgi:hypothetical protein